MPQQMFNLLGTVMGPLGLSKQGDVSPWREPFKQPPPKRLRRPGVKTCHRIVLVVRGPADMRLQPAVALEPLVRLP